MAEGGNGPLEEAPAATPAEVPEKMLTPQQSLHSIAVELSRQNRLTAQSLQLQATQIQLVQNVLDILRAQMANAGNAIGEQQDKALAMVEKIMEPFLHLAQGNHQRAPRIAPEPAESPTVVSESGGTRIEAGPEPEAP